MNRAAAGGSDLLVWIERRIGLTSAGLIVLGFAVLGWILGRLISSRAMLLLVYGVLIVVGVSYGMGRRRLAVLAERSDLPTRVRENQIVDVELMLQARRRVSTVILEEALPDQFGLPVHVPVPNLPSGEEVRHRYSFSPKLRGVYSVGPLVATWSDPFGLTRQRMVLAEPAKIIVHPATELVHDRVIAREWEDPPIRPPVSRAWPTGFEFYGMRDYQSGDDPRRIVWRKTAQTLDTKTGQGRYLVRESEQGITDRVVILLDTDREHHTGGEVSETFELAVRAAASLGTRHLDDGFSVSLEANAQRLAAELRGKPARIPYLDTLAAVQREQATLADSLDRVITGGRRISHYVVITPYLSGKIATRLRLMLDRGMSMLVVLVLSEDSDPMSVHRAGALGCGVVELRPKVALERAFARGVRMDARR